MITTYCYLLEIKTDSEEFYYTTLDKKIKIERKVYIPQTSLKIGDITNYKNSYSQVAISGSVTDKLISNKMVVNGKLDNAEIIIKLFDYENNEIIANLFSGFVTSVTEDNNVFKVEISSNAFMLDKKIMSVYTPFCRTSLGSKECGVDLGKYSHNCRISEVINDYSLKADIAKPTGFFNDGRLVIKGKTYDIKSYHNSVVTTYVRIDGAQKDAEITLIEGCTKRVDCCINKFANIINFRGEPHIPGLAQLLN